MNEEVTRALEKSMNTSFSETSEETLTQLEIALANNSKDEVKQIINDKYYCFILKIKHLFGSAKHDMIEILSKDHTSNLDVLYNVDLFKKFFKVEEIKDSKLKAIFGKEQDLYMIVTKNLYENQAGTIVIEHTLRIPKTDISNYVLFATSDIKYITKRIAF